MSASSLKPIDSTWVSQAESAVSFFNGKKVFKDSAEDAWLKKQRLAFSKGAIAEDKVDWLNEHLPHWEDRRNAKFDISWRMRADELVEFVRSRGRFPTGYEMPWYAQQKRKFFTGVLNASKVTYLSNILPGWNDKSVGF